MTAAEKLVRWRHQNDLSQRQAAELAGLSQPAWQSYENGAMPRTPAATKIQRVTNGEVSVDDWVESEEARAVRQARKKARRVSRPRAAS